MEIISLIVELVFIKVQSLCDPVLHSNVLLYERWDQNN